jgi:hypothetical protein
VEENINNEWSDTMSDDNQDNNQNQNNNQKAAKTPADLEKAIKSEIKQAALKTARAGLKTLVDAETAAAKVHKAATKAKEAFIQELDPELFQ